MRLQLTMKYFYCFLSVFLGISFSVTSQCIDTNTGFNLPENPCPQDPIQFTLPDAALGAAAYQWDFSTGELKNNPEISAISALSSADRPEHPEIVYDGENYYAFMVSFITHELYRADFGNQIENGVQNIVNLGNPRNQNGSTTFNEAGNIKIIQYEGNWYGFTVNSVAPLNIIRLDFGNALVNEPVAYILGNPGFNRSRSIEIAGDEAHGYALIISDINAAELITIPMNSPLDEINEENITRYSFGDGAIPFDISMLKICNEWHGITAGHLNNKVYHIFYENGFNELPLVEVIRDDLSAAGGELVEDGGNIYAFLASFNGDIYRFDFGPSIDVNNNNLTNLGRPIRSFIGFTLKKFNSHWYGFIVNRDNILFQLDFNENASLDFYTSDQENPAPITYHTNKDQEVALYCYDAEGNITHIFTDQVSFRENSVFPKFSFEDQCLGEISLFTDESENPNNLALNWTWDFGDGSPVSHEQHPSHEYQQAGSYQISLSIESPNACQSTLTQTIRISSGPTAAFSEIQIGCVGEAILFENTSISGNVAIDDQIGYYWDFGDDTFSPLENPTKVYDQTGLYTVTLIVTDEAGCLDQITHQIQIIESPVANFSFPQSICKGNDILFTDESEGLIEAWVWQIGSLEASEERNPLLRFADAGEYEVTLTVRSTNNCLHSVTKTIEVKDSPRLAFTFERDEANPLLLHFTNLSTGADHFTWEFTEGQSSQEVNPSYLFPTFGTYEVLLRGTSPNGCTSELRQDLLAGIALYDLSIDDIQSENQNNQMQYSVLLNNKSNVPLSSFMIYIIANKDTLVSEAYEGILDIGSTENYTVQERIDIDQLQNFEQLCIKVQLATAQNDLEPTDNEFCIHPKLKFSISKIYPNPIQSQLNLEYLASQNGTLTLAINSSNGAVSKNFMYDVSKGRHLISTDLSFLKKGLYILTLSFEEILIHQKVIVN